MLTTIIVHDTPHYDLGSLRRLCLCGVETDPQADAHRRAYATIYYPELDYKGTLSPEFWDYGPFNEKGPGEPSLRLTGPV